MKSADYDRPVVHCARWGLLLAALASAAPGACAEKPLQGAAASPAASKGDAESQPPLANPVVQLACDWGVQDELKLTAQQTTAIERAFAKIEERMWLARDVAAGPVAAQKAALADAFESDLGSILDAPQQARLRQLVVRAQGWPALTTDGLSQALQLDAGQKRRIEEVVESTRREIQQASPADSSATDRDSAFTSLRKREGTSIQKLLSTDQRARLAELVGPAYDLSRVGPLTFSAPQLKQVDAWIGSPPLKLAESHGKVVAFHFWAFGCINCIHNLPHYNAWHESFSPRGLVVLGMHTPETRKEHELPALEQKVKEYSIRYPVAADHENQNWTAWGNSMWPSVYLVDKRGRVRYWWYGELNWQGAEGEKFMRGKIEELLAERE